MSEFWIEVNGRRIDGPFPTRRKGLLAVQRHHRVYAALGGTYVVPMSGAEFLAVVDTDAIYTLMGRTATGLPFLLTRTGATLSGFIMPDDIVESARYLAKETR